jgi:homoaconitase/3-isopropylmalate dehydratase large subunit
MSNTLFDKVWDSHVVRKIEGGPDVLFIDRHMVHEVTSPVAFLGLKTRGLKVYILSVHLLQRIIIPQPSISIYLLQILFQRIS